MQPTRRTFLAATGVMIAAAGVTSARAAAADPAPKVPVDPRMADRSIGAPNAKSVAEEWFSFTCPHCARFAAEVFPQVKAQLIDTGKLRWTWREYPRDQVDLMAAMIARSLPPERYEPFMETLLASQPRWAFNRAVEPKDELAKMAALAGMPRDMFDHAVNDEQLKAAILAAQAEGEKTYNIDSTPTFIVNGRPHSGEVDVDTFKKWVAAV